MDILRCKFSHCAISLQTLKEEITLAVAAIKPEMIRTSGKALSMYEEHLTDIMFKTK